MPRKTAIAIKLNDLAVLTMTAHTCIGAFISRWSDYLRAQQLTGSRISRDQFIGLLIAYNMAGARPVHRNAYRRSWHSLLGFQLGTQNMPKYLRICEHLGYITQYDNTFSLTDMGLLMCTEYAQFVIEYYQPDARGGAYAGNE